MPLQWSQLLLTSKKLESDEKRMSKTFAKTGVQRSLQLSHCIVLTLHQHDRFKVESCFTRPNTIKANEGTEWEHFFSSQINALVKLLE